MTLDEVSKPRPTISLSIAEKILGAAVAIGTVVFSVGGNYMLVSYRLAEHDRRLENQEARIVQVEQNGNTDQERRLTKLEIREDEGEKNISAMKSELDVCVAILNRLDRDTGKVH